MSKVKVGDKVRALVDERGITKGNLYEVFYIDSFNDVLVIDDAKEKHWLFENEYELIEPTLKEKYLVSGNVVETENGYMYLVVENLLLRLNGKEYMLLDDYDGMLTTKYDVLDIVKVYRINDNIPFNRIKDNLTLIWQREEEKITIELTKEQLNKIREKGLL